MVARHHHSGLPVTFFVTTIEFRPTLQKQHDDAERKGQVARRKIFDGLLTRLNDQQAG
jgi:hypothetical protein